MTIYQTVPQLSDDQYISILLVFFNLEFLVYSSLNGKGSSNGCGMAGLCCFHFL